MENSHNKCCSVKALNDAVRGQGVNYTKALQEAHKSS